MNVPTLPKPELHLLTIEEVTEVTKECIKETVGEYEEYNNKKKKIDIFGFFVLQFRLNAHKNIITSTKFTNLGLSNS